MDTCNVARSWIDAFAEPALAAVETALPKFLVRQRWFGGKARSIAATDIRDVIELHSNGEAPLVLVLITVTYHDGDLETYLLPLAFASGEHAARLLADSPATVLINVTSQSGAANGLICNAARDRDCWVLLHDAVARNRRMSTRQGELVGWHNDTYHRIRGDGTESVEPSVLRAEQSNSAAVFGSRFILKLFRKLDGGVNPDLEISRHLTEQLKFPHAPALVGAIEYHAAGAEPMTVAIMHEFVGNSVQAWEFTLNEFGRYLERVRTQFATVNLNAEMTAELKSAAHWMDLVDQEPTALAREAIGPFLHSAALLGQRTAELHRALVTATDNPAFVPEPFTPAYQRGLFQSMRAHAHHVLQVLKRQLSQLPEDAQADARAIVAIEANIIGRFREMAERRFTAVRIRCHGDYHLGQVLATGDDFKLIDFEGEPMRAIRERRIKCSPLRDVAGMLRSFHYASHAGLLTAPSEAAAPSRDSASLTEWARFHYIWSSAVFVRSYLTHVGDAAFVPTSRDELRCLLDVYLLEKSLYELDYEMNNRPTWVSIPIRGVLDLMGIATETQTAAIGQDGSGAVQE